MPIDFLDGADYVDFGTPAQLANLSTFTTMAWLRLDDWGHGANAFGWLFGNYNSAKEGGWQLFVENSVFTQALWFNYWWDTTIPSWIADNVLSLATLTHVALTYDNSSTANNPAIYVNGVSKAVTRQTAPVGSIEDDSDCDYYLGNQVETKNRSIDGKLGDWRIYDTILSASDIFDIYNMKSFRLHAPYPIFRIMGIGAAGLQEYDGASLGATNYIIDDIEGVQGTPSGNPVGVADTWLAY